MAFAYRRIFNCIPGYIQIGAGHQKNCIDGILGHPCIELWQSVFEHLDDGEILKNVDPVDREFLKENALKVLEVVKVWQGDGRSPVCKAWGIYLAGLIVSLCFSLGTLQAYMFGLLSHFYYLTVLFMVLSCTVSQYSTPTALKRLRRDFALTMEFPALGYTAAAMYPDLYENPWYSFIIIALTTLHLIWNRFLPVIRQDRLCRAHRRRVHQAIEQGPVGDQAYDTADHLRPDCTWLETLDILESAVEEIDVYLKYSGSFRHNTQVTLLSEGWNNVIVRLYDLMEADIRHDRLSRLTGTEYSENASSGMVKLVLTLLFFPVAIARVPPLFKADEYGAFAQSCIAVIDVGVTLSYRTRSESYTIPAFSDLYSAVMIFSAAGLLPIWVLWKQPDTFSEDIWLLTGGYAYMLFVTFVAGPALIYLLKFILIKRFTSEQAAIEWLESQAEPSEYPLDFSIEYPLEYRMGRSNGKWSWFSPEYPMGLPTGFASCFPSLYPPMILSGDPTISIPSEPSRVLPDSFNNCFANEHLMGVIEGFESITGAHNNNLDGKL